ncbi:Putative beta-lactamase, melanin type secondary metabolite synthesis protein OS=Streptomyces glaucescens OX=1907 GN=SGLAU_02685 PE=4 SV=1 [Streptomyces glaucescens]
MDQPGLSAVTVRGEPGGWTVTLTDDGHDLPLRLSGEGWTVAEDPAPVAVSGGWTDATTLSLDLLFLETPHHLLLTCSLPDRVFTAGWSTQPLHGSPLRTRCAPRHPSP